MADFDRETASEKLLALADYLEVDPETIIERDDRYYGIYDSTFETADGEVYVVLDEDEADDAMIDSVESFLDDCGVDGFAPFFQDWIYEHAIDADWFEDAFKEDQEYYANDIVNEEDRKFKNRLIQELYDEDILTDDDFEHDEDDEPMFDECNFDNDELVEKYVEYRMSQGLDYIEEMKFQLGNDWFKDVVKKENLLDVDEITKELIRTDGRGPSLSYYDGEEHDLGNGYYAYRVD
jgi:hypothetical protein